jgi:hypothetical protein
MRYSIDERRREAGLIARESGGGRNLAASKLGADSVTSEAFARGKAAANERIASLSKPKR